MRKMLFFLALFFAFCFGCNTSHTTGSDAQEQELLQKNQILEQAEDTDIVQDQTDIRVISGEDDLQAFCAEDTNCYRKIVINNVSKIPAYAFYKCKNLQVLEMNNVDEIGDYAFCDCNRLSEISWPENLKTIGECSFKNTAIVDLNIPNGVTECGISAFDSCTKLKNVIIPGSIGIIEMGFCNCQELENVTICDGVKQIGIEAFSKCPKLKELMIPKSVEIVGACIAYDSGLQRIIFEGSPTICGIIGHEYNNLTQICFLNEPPLQDPEILDEMYPDNYGIVTEGSKIAVYYLKNFATDWDRYIKENGMTAIMIDDIDELPPLN